VITKRIVEGHTGSIWAESQPGQATTVLVSLPFSHPDEVPFDIKAMEN